MSIANREENLHYRLSKDEEMAVSVLTCLKTTNYQRQASNGFVYYLVKPPKLLEFLHIPLFNPQTHNVHNVEQLTDQFISCNLFDQIPKEDNLSYDDPRRTLLLRLGRLLNQFLASPIQLNNDDLSQHLHRTNDGPFKFIQMILPDMHDDSYDEKVSVSLHQRKVTCAIYEDKPWITITDINNIIMFRLEMLGFEILHTTKVKANVYSNLRSIQSQGKILKQGCPFLRALTQAGCIVMHRDQKVYPWACDKHGNLLKKVIEHAYKQTQKPSAVILGALNEPALTLMSSKDVNALNEKLQDLLY